MLRKINNIYDVSIGKKTIASIEMENGIFRKELSFLSSERNNGKIVYTNYPEFIGKDKGLSLAKYGYCPNQQNVGPGEIQVFFSHHNRTGKTLWYGIQIFNPNPKSAFVTLKNWGFGKTFAQTIQPIQAFLTTTEETPKEVGVNGVHWILNQKIESALPYNPFCGIVRFYVDKPVTVTCYAYENISEITGNEVVHPYSLNYSDDLKVYSGIGTGFILSKTIELDVGKLKNNDYWYYTGEPAEYGRNQGELTPIQLAGETSKVAKADNTNPDLTQVGNWTTQYNFTIKITNNTGSAKKVYGFICGNSEQSNPVIMADGKIKGWQSLTADTRRWFEETVPTGVSEYKFTYMQASYGATAVNHAWSLSPNLAP